MRVIKTIGSVICLMAALVALIGQFRISSIWPLVFASLFIIPIRWLRPSWFRAAWVVPVGGSLLLVVDAYALRHRMAVEARAWQPVWDITDIVQTYVSPSGQTTVYLLRNSWLDSSYSVCVSAGGLFPLAGDVVPHGDDTLFRDLTAGWHGPLFSIGDHLISYAYSETDHRAYTYDDWIHGPRTIDDTTKTREGFAAYVTSLQPRTNKMRVSLQRIILPFVAFLISSCTCVWKDSRAVASCCSPLSLEQIAKDLGFQMEYLGMHEYHFYNEKCEFDLSAASNTIYLMDESSDKSSRFSPVWALNGDISEDVLKSKIRTYLYGHKAEPADAATGVPLVTEKACAAGCDS